MVTLPQHPSPPPSSRSTRWDVPLEIAVPIIIMAMGIGLITALWFGYLQELYEAPIREARIKVLADAKIRLATKIDTDATAEEALAAKLYKEDKYDEAARHYKASIELIETLTGMFPYETKWLLRNARTYNRIGNIYIHAKNSDAAEKAFLGELAIRQEQSDTSALASCLQTLGRIEEGRNNLTKAETYYHSYAVQRNKTYVERKTKIYDSFDPLIRVYRLQKRYDQAITCTKQLIDTNKKIVAVHSNNEKEANSAIASNYSTLGAIHKEIKDNQASLNAYKEALIYHKASIALDTSSGSDYEYYLMSLCHNNVADLLKEMGDTEGGIEHFRESKDIARRLVETDPKDTQWKAVLAAAYFNLGQAQDRNKEYEQALLNYVAARSMWQQLEPHLGAHQWRYNYCLSVFRLAKMLLIQEKVDDALVLCLIELDLHKPLTIADPQNDQWQNLLGDTLAAAGDCYVAKEDNENAYEMFRLCCIIRRTRYEEDKTDLHCLRSLVSTLEGLGTACMDTLKYPALLTARQETVELRKSICQLVPNNARETSCLVKALFDLGVAYSLVNKHEEAIKTYEAERELLGTLLAQDPNDIVSIERTADCLSNLAGSRQALKELDTAIELYKTEMKWRQELTAKAPDKITAYLEERLGTCHYNQAIVYSQLKNIPASQQAYSDSIAPFAKSLQLNPDNRKLTERLIKCYQLVRDYRMEKDDKAEKVAAWEANRGAIKLLEQLVNVEKPATKHLTELGHAYLLSAQPSLAEKNYAKGEEAFESAARVTRKFIELNPKDIAARNNLCTCLQNLGYVRNKQENYAEAAAAFQECIQVLLSVIKDQPDNVKAPRELAKMYGNYATAMREQKQMPEAADARSKALEYFRKAHADRPDDDDASQKFGEALFELGLCQQENKKLTEAEQNLLSAKELQQKLMDRHPEHLASVWNLTRTHHELGSVYQERRENARAKESYLIALELYTKINKLNPDNSPQFCHMGDCYMRMAETEDAMGDKAKPPEMYMLAAQSYKQAADIPPGQANCRRKQGIARQSLANYYRQQKKYPEAAENYKAASEIRKALLESNPQSATLQTDLTQAHYWLGITQKAQENMAGARESFQTAAEIRRKLADKYPTDLMHQVNLSFALDNLGVVCESLGDLPAAAKALEGAIAARQLLTEKKPEMIDAQPALCESIENLARVRVKQLDDKAAQELYNKALTILQKLESDGKITDAGQAQLKKLRETMAKRPAPAVASPIPPN